MAKLTGFLEYKRELPLNKSVTERVNDYNEFVQPFSRITVEKQAARCMECGVPFCHNACPLGNNIPDFNDMVYKENWKAAYHILTSTNNFPEFTGRICPAPCESACVLSINNQPTTIELIEKNVIERAFREGWVQPVSPLMRTGKKVAIVGSGPAGLAAVSQLNSAGHTVTVFERSSRVGGLLRYGIPDFKLEKHIINRRVALMEGSGIIFKTSVDVGTDVSVEELRQNFDAVLLAVGSNVPRDIDVPGRNLSGVHFAMDFLAQSNRRVAGDKILRAEEIVATGKHVLVIGGGDTGSDCVGTSIRQGAASVTQIELLPKPATPTGSNSNWPNVPLVLKTSTSHEEGCTREWSVSTRAFLGDAKGKVGAAILVNVQWTKDKFTVVEGSEREVPCDLVLLAIGFKHPQYEGLLEQLGVKIDERGNVWTSAFQTSVIGVFAAGDVRRGQSLVVHAISEGREAAREMDIFLSGASVLESKNHSLINVI